MAEAPHRHLTGAAWFRLKNVQLISAIGFGFLVLCLCPGCQTNESSGWSARREAMNEFQRELQKDTQEGLEDLSAALGWLFYLGQPFIPH